MEINGALVIFQRNFNRSVVLLDCREGLLTLLRYGNVCLLRLGTGTNLGTKVNGRFFFWLLMNAFVVFPGFPIKRHSQSWYRRWSSSRNLKTSRLCGFENKEF